MSRLGDSVPIRSRTPAALRSSASHGPDRPYYARNPCEAIPHLRARSSASSDPLSAAPDQPIFALAPSGPTRISVIRAVMSALPASYDVRRLGHGVSQPKMRVTQHEPHQGGLVNVGILLVLPKPVRQFPAGRKEDVLRRPPHVLIALAFLEFRRPSLAVQGQT